MSDPLPNLSSRYFGCCRVLHQIKDRHCPGASQPRLQVLHSDTYVCSKALLCNGCFRSEPEEVAGSDHHVFPFPIDLIRAFHDSVESLQSNLDKARMRNPRPIMAIVSFTFFVCSNLCECFPVCLLIVLDRNLSRHAPHRVNPSSMAGLNTEQRIPAHKMRRHPDQGPVGQNKPRFITKALDAAEDIVPTPAIQPGRMVSQFVQDFVHLKGRKDRLD